MSIQRDQATKVGTLTNHDVRVLVFNDAPIIGPASSHTSCISSRNNIGIKPHNLDQITLETLSQVARVRRPRAKRQTQTYYAVADSDKIEFAHQLLEFNKHFDPDYYAYEYPDIALKRSALLAHFCQFGWREGRNPNAFFDTVTYLLQNKDVANSNNNPYHHYLKHGIVEGRLASSSISPSIRSRLLFGVVVRDWVERLRPHIDVDFYRHQLEDSDAVGLDLAAHFAYRGWRESKSPNPSFNVSAWMQAHAAATRFMVNPLLVQLEVERGTFDLSLLTEKQLTNAPLALDQASLTFASKITTGTSATRESGVSPFIRQLTVDHPEFRPSRLPQNDVNESFLKTDGLSERDQLSIVQQEFSRDYYLAAYPDVARVGIDPLLHFFHTGWREDRNPNQSFDTNYYLKINKDVRDAGLNPFWHYLVAGKSEGRLPHRPGGYRRQIVDAAVEPASKPPAIIDPDEKVISSAELRRKLKAVIKNRKGLIVSLSHDCYIRVIGGTQIFISDEQRRFNELGYAYIHVSPQISRLTLANEDPQFLTRLIVDGTLFGLSPIREVTRIFAALHANGAQPSVMIAHCILGFCVPDIINLCSALQPERRIYWLHDYSSICEGFNLLRNDAQFCGAPPPDSLACRVCVYGKTRPTHLAEIRSLFAACKFDVVSPSLFTLNLWRKSTNLPRYGETAHPHWQLTPKKRPQKQFISKLPADSIAVAFVGFPSANKGWPLFSETVRRLTNDSRYRFFHFAAKGTSSLPGVTFIQTEVTSKDRNATQRLLAENRIDLVMLLSPWPETFSFVAHEAIGAGAKLICLSDSGNVVDLVRILDAGQILPNGDAIIDFFVSGAAVTLIKEPKQHSTAYEIEHIGTTATIDGILEFTGKR